MTNGNRRQDDMSQQNLESWQGLENDRLDRELDAALLRFATGEPRTGLEERVLANLRAQTKGIPISGWRLGTALVAMATVIIAIALSFIWKSSAPQQAVFVHPSSTVTQDATHGGTSTPGKLIRQARQMPIQKFTSLTLRPAQSDPAAAPRLDRFPSPQPLSEQEKILASYVAQFQNHAALVARARMESLRSDLTEEMNDPPLPRESAD